MDKGDSSMTLRTTYPLCNAMSTLVKTADMDGCLLTWGKAIQERWMYDNWPIEIE